MYTLDPREGELMGNELVKIPDIGCRFYGRSHAALESFHVLWDQGGNECALITTSYSPCRMERLGLPVIEYLCPIAICRALD